MHHYYAICPSSIPLTILPSQYYTLLRIMIQNGEGKEEQGRRYEMVELFPRKPYEIQMNIAEMLYQTLSSGKIKLAIIQSPTGTGKTYSLLVPLIAWLSKNRTSIKNEKSVSEQKVSVPSWLKKPSEQKVEKLLSKKKKRVEEAISIADAQKQLKKAKLKHLTPTKTAPKEEEEIQVSSEQENNNNQNFKRNHQKKLEMMVEKQLKVEDETILPKIIFVSRTHSQLSQVIDSIKLILKEDKDMKYLEIASKDHLCINSAINSNKLNISQRCQYILDHSKCEYFHSLSIKQFFNNNIEQATSLGSTHNLCPYYGTRNLIQGCDIICLPYASILNADIRNRIGINLHNSIVVFDQGHNVIDNEKQLHSPQILLEDVAVLTQQIDQYLKKYGERLKIANSKLLIHLLEILRAIIVTSERIRKDNPSSEQKKYIRIGYLQFIGELAMKQMKIFKIVKYIQLNNLDQKLAYFNSKDTVIDKSKTKGNHEQQKKISVAKINNILQFLVEFAHFDELKQILLLKWQDSKRMALKIFCLESGELSKIIDKSRLTIIAGGTMQPLNDFQSLFQHYKDKFVVKKYPHIIKKSQCSVSIIKKAANRQILFNHQTLNDKNSLENLKRICLEAIVKIMKKTEKGGGIVIFIQNYRLVAFFKEVFKNQPFYSRMLFDGKQPQQSKNKDVFETYKKLVEGDKQNNHFLLSVMGGKLSQGINFSDRLARSLIVFGLPYSNIYAPEVVQAIAYNQKHKKSTKNEYLESLCLRTLNQTIGRGVRHISDYVDIYLIDCRFDGIKYKLSEWMRDRVTVINDIEAL